MSAPLDWSSAVPHIPLDMSGAGFLFIRHGEALDVEGRCIGQTDVPLSPHGVTTVEALAIAWPSLFPKIRPVRLVSSDLRRAADSAALLNVLWDLDIEHDPRLREMSFGAWDGRLWTDLADEDQSRLGAWMAAWTEVVTPGGEGAGDLVRRAGAWLADNTGQSEGWTVVVAHAGWIRAALCLLLEQPVAGMFSIPVDHARVTAVQREAGRYHLIASNQG